MIGIRDLERSYTVSQSLCKSIEIAMIIHNYVFVPWVTIMRRFFVHAFHLDLIMGH